MKFDFKGKADREELIALLQDMVRIDSVNTYFGKGGGDEFAMADYVCRFCDKNGLAYEIQEVTGGRNRQVLIRLPGEGAGKLCFEAHLDTVPVDEMTIDPFDPVIKDGKIWGRGSCDCKGSVAGMLYALKMLKDNGVTPPCDIYLCAAAEEEFSYRGVLRLLEDAPKFDAAIVGEPTDCSIFTCCKGTARFKIVSRGIGGHSSKPWLGRNAIIEMAHVICELEEKLFPEYEKVQHPMLGPATFCISMIEGGSFINKIPDYCEIQIDRRLLPGDDYSKVRKEVETCLAGLLADHPEYDIEVLDPFLEDIAMDTDQNEVIVKTACASCDQILGGHKIEAMYGSCDASKLSKNGIPSIVLGPGSMGKAHTNDEFVPIDELIAASEIYAQICADFRP